MPAHSHHSPVHSTDSQHHRCILCHRSDLDKLVTPRKHDGSVDVDGDYSCGDWIWCFGFRVKVLGVQGSQLKDQTCRT